MDLTWDARKPMAMDRTTEFNADDFEPAQKLAQDSEDVRKRFKAKFKRFAARLPFAEDLLAAYYCAFDRDTPRHVQFALLGFADDAAVLATALRLVASYIRPEHRAAAKRVLDGLRP